MDFSLTQDFPAGLDDLWSVFGRPEYTRQKYLALGATAVRVRYFRVTTQAIEVDLERDVPVDPSHLPPWARAFVGGRQTLRHHTRWRRIGAMQACAELDISPIGLPVRARGIGTIVEMASGTTRMALDWRVRAMLPVMGRPVERLFAAQVRDALDADHAFSLRYLRALDPSALDPDVARR